MVSFLLPLLLPSITEKTDSGQTQESFLGGCGIAAGTASLTLSRIEALYSFCATFFKEKLQPYRKVETSILNTTYFHLDLTTGDILLYLLPLP